MTQRSLVAAGALGLAIATGGVSAATAQEVVWRASGSFPAGHSTSIALESFASEVARPSDGEIRIALLPGNTLGGGFEQVDQLRTGQIQMAWGGVGDDDRLIPEFAASVLPFAATASQRAICRIDGDVGDHLRAAAEDKGLVIGGFGMIGARHVTDDRRPIRTVEDLEGLEIRTPSGEAWTLTFDACGALTDKQRAAVDQAIFVATAAQRAISDRENQTARDGLVAGGMEYYQIPDEERAKFRDKTKPVYEQIREKVGDETMDLAGAAVPGPPSSAAADPSGRGGVAAAPAPRGTATADAQLSRPLS